MNILEDLIYNLNNPSKNIRIKNVNKLKEFVLSGKISFPSTGEVNNHIHTKFSFSPWYPSACAFEGLKAGLIGIGIMDHDSVAGCRELIFSAASFGIHSTCGFEIRTSFLKTKFKDYKINNPDSKGIAYISIHGIPVINLNKVNKFLTPVRKQRLKRSRLMVERLNSIITTHGLKPISFNREIIPISEYKHGGSLTERHILQILSQRIINSYGKGEKVIFFLEKGMKIKIPEKIREYLTDKDNPHYLYDLLGILKAELLEKFFIQPDEIECPPVNTIVEFADNTGGISCYSYLGDVKESPTGDKKEEKFEDEFLDDLFKEIKSIGFKGVTYMPPRNTIEQIQRVKKLAEEYELVQISGVDINSSRQSFNCPLLKEKEFSNLITTTKALFAHEKLSAKKIELGLFHPKNPFRNFDIEKRVKLYALFSERIDPFNPYNTKKLIKEITGEHIWNI